MESVVGGREMMSLTNQISAGTYNTILPQRAGRLCQLLALCATGRTVGPAFKVHDGRNRG